LRLVHHHGNFLEGSFHVLTSLATESRQGDF
jgi:hypothetical protein